MRGRRWVVAAVMLASASAHADDPADLPWLTQFNVSLVAQGMGAHDDRGWSGGAHLTLRPELCLGRRSGGDLGAGPYLEGGGQFSNREVGGLFGAGALLLVPLGRANALVPSLGGYATFRRELGLQPGVTGGLFLGARQFNPTSRFDGAWGLRLDVRFGLGTAHEVVAALGFQVDLSWLGALLSWAL